MELYKLNLQKSLEYAVLAELKPPVWESITNLVHDMPEGTECLAEIAETAAITVDEHGPHATLPMPEPLQFGTSTVKVHEQNEPVAIVPQGTYLFTQHSWTDFESAYIALNWFIRESWWQREAAQGPFYMRWVREENKTAIQIFRKKKEL